MNLKTLQTEFQSILLNDEVCGVDWVSNSVQNLSSKQRLGIYHNAYRVRLIDVLFDTFEHTNIYLGHDWFQRLAASYVQSHPSKHHDIGLHGEKFPHYLSLQFPEDKEIPELALMDWKLRRCFNGSNAEVMTQHDLQEMMLAEGEISQILFVPTLSISTHCFNTLDIWHAINVDETPPTAEKLTKPIDILLWRKGHSPHFRSLSVIESKAISYLSSGCSISLLGDHLAEDFPDRDVSVEFGRMLSLWIEDGLLVKD